MRNEDYRIWYGEREMHLTQVFDFFYSWQKKNWEFMLYDILSLSQCKLLGFVYSHFIHTMASIQQYTELIRYRIDDSSSILLTGNR